MDKLNKLAKQYAKTKDKKICQEIFKLLNKTIKDKADYMFYKQKFIKDKDVTFAMEIFDREKKTFIKKEIPSCFRLCDIKKYEWDDIYQEIILKILQLLNTYDGIKPFRNYLFYSLKRWKPSCIQDINFIKRLDDTNESDLPKADDKKMTLNMLGSNISRNPIELNDLFEDLTDIEKKVINLKLHDPEIKTQAQIAEKLGVTQKTISKIFSRLQKKCKFEV